MSEKSLVDRRDSSVQLFSKNPNHLPVCLKNENVLIL